MRKINKNKITTEDQNLLIIFFFISNLFSYLCALTAEYSLTLCLTFFSGKIFTLHVIFSQETRIRAFHTEPSLFL